LGKEVSGSSLFVWSAGHTASGVTDHWPCDYEQKVRVAALALGKMKKTPWEERSKLSTTLMSRTRHT
jgi:hypothetical protein